MEKKYAYVECLLGNDVITELKDLVAKVVTDDNFYYSDVISRISGDVTAKAHLTLFYGLDESEMNNSELKDYIKNIEIAELQLNNFMLFDGYQNMYKVLCIEVDDSSQKLLAISRKLSQFKHEGDYEFKPHITLAYVKADYVLPAETNPAIEPIPVKQIRLSI